MGLFWMGYRMMRRANRRSRYYRRCRSAKQQRESAFMTAYVVSSLLLAYTLTSILQACGVDTAHAPGWAAILVLGGGFGLPALALWGLWHNLQGHTSQPPPPPPPPSGWEPPNPDPVPRGPIPPNRQAPKDRPFPHRPY